MSKTVENPTHSKRHRPVRSPRGKLSSFALCLLKEWIRLELSITDDLTVVVAVSGGADSTALLLAFNELINARRIALRIVIAHLDHGLRKEQGREDARWVQTLAESLSHEIELGRARVDQRARNTTDNLEQAARRARYDFLAKVAKKHRAEVVVTAHTLNDQAETILLRLLRGSGADGLAGITPVRRLAAKSQVALVRPLINWARRTDTERYCRLRNFEFRQDGMNEDERFARVRVRKQLLPLLTSFNGKVIEGLARTADLLRADAEALNQAAAMLLINASQSSPHDNSGTSAPLLSVEVLARAPVAIMRRALRQWISGGRGNLRGIELVHLRGIENLLAGNHGGRVAELPGGVSVRRRKGFLELRAGKS